MAPRIERVLTASILHAETKYWRQSTQWKAVYRRINCTGTRAFRRKHARTHAEKHDTTVDGSESRLSVGLTMETSAGKDGTKLSSVTIRHHQSVGSQYNDFMIDFELIMSNSEPLQKAAGLRY